MLVKLSDEFLKNGIDVVNCNVGETPVVGEAQFHPLQGLQLRMVGSDEGSSPCITENVGIVSNHGHVVKEIACAIVKYYETVGRPLDLASLPTMMHWSVLSDFHLQHQALLTLTKGDVAPTPKITRALPIMKWTEAFSCHLFGVIGVRGIPFGVCDS